MPKTTERDVPVHQASYVLVLFRDDKKVAIVARSWLAMDSQEGLVCYWPPNKQRDRARNLELPDKERWQRYSVSIKSKTDNFTAALRREERYLYTSSVETEKESDKENEDNDTANEDADDEFDGSQKTASRKSLFSAQTYSSKKLGNLPKPPTYPAKEMTVQQNRKRRSESEDPDAEIPSEEKIRRSYQTPPQPIGHPVSHSTPRVNALLNDNQNLTTSQSGVHSTQHPCTAEDSRNASTSRSNDFEVRVLSLLQNILENQRKTSQEKQADMELEDLIPTPLTTTEELDEFCKCHLSTATQRKQMTAMLLCFGGTEMADSVRRMMPKIATNQVWSNFSMKGRRQKRAFVKTLLYKCIARALYKIHKDSKEAGIECEVGHYLKHAPHRRGGPLFKGQNKSTTEVAERDYLLSSDSEED